MTIGEMPESVDARLARLATLHTAGDLDDEEFRAAKARVLDPGAEHGPHPGSDPLADTRTDPSSVPLTVSGPATADAAVDRPRGRTHWWIWLFVAITIGFSFACLGAAVTSLQRPAGPLLCSGSTLHAGNASEHFGGTTAYNIDSACIDADGTIHELSQVSIIGALWLVYSVVTFVVIAALVVLAKGIRALRHERE
jgi:hypothetical protein